MKYSIIIPTLNEERLLPVLLEQLKTINIPNDEIELIVSDGGSTDDTLKIAQKHGARILKSDTKQNIAIGRHSGAKIAKSNLLIFINADILFADIVGFFDRLDTILHDSEISAVTFKVKIHPSERLFADSIFLNFYNVYFYLMNLIGIGMGRGECQVIRKNIYDKVGG